MVSAATEFFRSCISSSFLVKSFSSWVRCFCNIDNKTYATRLKTQASLSFVKTSEMFQLRQLYVGRIKQWIQLKRQQRRNSTFSLRIFDSRPSRFISASLFCPLYSCSSLNSFEASIARFLIW